MRLASRVRTLDRAVDQDPGSERHRQNDPVIVQGRDRIVAREKKSVQCRGGCEYEDNGARFPTHFAQTGR